MRNVDLNLLPSLQALLELRNVSRAAERMHLSQPAMSAALSRLRRHFNDDLLVRSGREYVLTSFGQSLMPRVDQAMEDVRIAMQLRTDFDPASSDRTFVVAASDYVTSVLIRPLRARIAAEAPGIAVDFVPTSQTRVDQGPEIFSSIDLVIGPMGFGLIGSSRQLFRDEFVAVMDPAHPLLERSELTVSDIAATPQAVGEFGGSIVTPAMRLFQVMGKEPVVAARMSGLQALPALVEGTDLVALVPKLLAVRAARRHSITMVEFADELEAPLVEAMYWHPLQGEDPAVLWLKSVVQGAVQELREEDGEAHPVRIQADEQQ